MTTTTPTSSRPDLALAFDVAERIHARKGRHLLTLVAVDEHEWVATFDSIREGDGDDWYESFRIANYPHSARSTDPAQAIMEAARKLVEDLGLDVTLE